jgi:hypothetical protein
VALVDARGGGVDDHEHLGGEVLALAVEDDAGDVHGARVVGAVVAIEVERRQPVLSVDDQVLAVGLLEVAHVFELPHRLEAQLLGG